MAAKYRKISPSIWNDAKFRRLSDNGKLVFLFILTHPAMTAIGAMRGTIPGLAAEIGWTPEAFREAFGEAFREGLISVDEKASFLACPNFVKHNLPESPNVVRSWRDVLLLVPECEARVLHMVRMKSHLEALHEGFAKAFAEAFPEALGEALPKALPQSGTGTGTGTGTGFNTPQSPPRGEGLFDADAEASTAPKRKPRKTQPDYILEDIVTELVLPSWMLGQSFRQAWDDWNTYRVERNLSKYTRTSVKTRFREFAEWGELKTVAAITASIANNYQGIFPAGANGANQQRGTKPIHRIHDESKDWDSIPRVVIDTSQRPERHDQAEPGPLG